MADPLCNADNDLLFLVVALFARLVEKHWHSSFHLSWFL